MGRLAPVGGRLRPFALSGKRAGLRDGLIGGRFGGAFDNSLFERPPFRLGPAARLDQGRFCQAFLSRRGGRHDGSSLRLRSGLRRAILDYSRLRILVPAMLA